MWLEKFSLWSIITRTPFSLVMNSSFLRFSSLKSSMVCEFEISFPKCITLQFDVLSFNSRVLDDLMSWLISSWSSLCEVTEINFCINFVSSPNKNNSASVSLGKSMQIINSTGSNTLPWGTPLLTFFQFDKVLFTRTCCLQCDKKFLIQSKRLPLIP